MAQIKHLPIYKTTYELLELVVRVTKDFPKDFKYTLGDKIRLEVIDLVVFIFKANATRQNKIKMMCERQSPKQEVRAVANSYLGIFGQANSWVERKKLAIMMSQYGWWFSPKLDKVILRKGTT